MAVKNWSITVECEENNYQIKKGKDNEKKSFLSCLSNKAKSLKDDKKILFLDYLLSIVFRSTFCFAKMITVER